MVHSEVDSGGWWTRALHLGRGSRGPWVIGAGLALAAGVALGLGLKPLVRSQARHAAQARGVQLAIGDVSLSWRRVTLSNVGVSLKDVDVLHCDVDRVDVTIGWTLKPEAIEVAGGEVTLTGSLDRIESELKAWRERLPHSAESSSSGPGMDLAMNGVNVTWEQPGSTQPQASLTAMSYVRRPPQLETIGLKSARVNHDGLSLSVSDASVVLDRNKGERTLRELEAGAVDATLTLSEQGSSGEAPPSGQAAKPPAPAGRAKQPSGATKRPPGSRFADLLPALDAARGQQLRARIKSLTKAAQDKLPPDSKVTLDKLSVTLVHEGEKLHLGPNRFLLERQADRIQLALLPGSRLQPSPLTLKLDVPFGDGEVRTSVSGGPVSLASLGVKEGDFSLREVDRSELAARGVLALSGTGDAVAIEMDGRLSPLSFGNRSLSDQLLRGSSLKWNGKAKAQLDGSRYEIEHWELALGDVEVALSGVVRKESDRVTAQVSAGIPLASCQSLLDSAPEGLLPLLKGLKLAGTFALDAAVSFDTSDLSKMRVKWDFQNECRITQVPVELSPRRFLGEFRLQVKDVTGRIVSIETGPGTPNWTPYAGISPHMETAVLICEDGRFFRHQGFDREAIENSIKENVKAGRFVRGASTISMQLAKNLYLSFDKTMSRKLQEAVLTTLLEQELSKEEMMELYLNVIEYGPGIYGITAAAEHYFKTTPAQLSLGQSLYLASILPNPAQQHFTESGAVSEGWMRYLQRLMKIAVKIGRVSEAEYQAALEEQLQFGQPSVSSQGLFLPPPSSDLGVFGAELPELEEGL